MVRKTIIIAALGVFGALAFAAGSAMAGTCSLVTVSATAADPATATTKAQGKLIKRSAGLGSIRDSSTKCKQGPLGSTCKISATVCPNPS